MNKRIKYCYRFLIEQRLFFIFRYSSNIHSTGLDVDERMVQFIFLFDFFFFQILILQFHTDFDFVESYD